MLFNRTLIITTVFTLSRIKYSHPYMSFKSPSGCLFPPRVCEYYRRKSSNITRNLTQDPTLEVNILTDFDDLGPEVLESKYPSVLQHFIDRPQVLIGLKDKTLKHRGVYWFQVNSLIKYCGF